MCIFLAIFHLLCFVASLVRSAALDFNLSGGGRKERVVSATGKQAYRHMHARHAYVRARACVCDCALARLQIEVCTLLHFLAGLLAFSNWLD